MLSSTKHSRKVFPIKGDLSNLRSPFVDSLCMALKLRGVSGENALQKACVCANIKKGFAFVVLGARNKIRLR